MQLRCVSVRCYKEGRVDAWRYNLNGELHPPSCRLVSASVAQPCFGDVRTFTRQDPTSMPNIVVDDIGTWKSYMWRC